MRVGVGGIAGDCFGTGLPESFLARPSLMSALAIWHESRIRNVWSAAVLQAKSAMTEMVCANVSGLLGRSEDRAPQPAREGSGISGSQWCARACSATCVTGRGIAISHAVHAGNVPAGRRRLAEPPTVKHNTAESFVFVTAITDARQKLGIGPKHMPAASAIFDPASTTLNSRTQIEQRVASGHHLARTNRSLDWPVRLPGPCPARSP